MAAVLPAVIGAAAGLGQSIIRGRQSRKNVERTIQGQMNLAEYAYNKDLEMWNRQNEYNLPANQMQRLEDAGLNKNLIYGGGPGNTASEMPKYQAPKPDFAVDPAVNIDQLGGYYNLAQQSAMIDNVKAQQRLTDERALTESVDRALKATKRLSAKAEADMKGELAKYSKELAEITLGKRKQELTNLSLTEELRGKESRRKDVDLETQETLRDMRKLELEDYQEHGIRPTDQFYWRFLNRLKDQLDPRQLLKGWKLL